MKNILLTIAYDGTDFSGWQIQPHARTVQGELERVLSTLCKEKIGIHGTSRTDAGVHALGQCASFCSGFEIPVERIPIAANGLLAKRDGMREEVGAIQILRAVEMPMAFHARHDCIGKTYRYRIRFGMTPDVFQRNRCFQIRQTLDTAAMKEGAAYFVGTHDFRSFMTWGGRELRSYVRTVYDLQLIQEGNELQIEITGDGFLYNMVRIIVGTLVQVGRGKRKPSDMLRILEARDRSSAGLAAPAQGLYLEKIYYDHPPWEQKDGLQGK